METQLLTASSSHQLLEDVSNLDCWEVWWSYFWFLVCLSWKQRTRTSCSLTSHSQSSTEWHFHSAKTYTRSLVLRLFHQSRPLGPFLNTCRGSACVWGTAHPAGCPSFSRSYTGRGHAWPPRVWWRPAAGELCLQGGNHKRSSVSASQQTMKLTDQVGVKTVTTETGTLSTPKSIETSLGPDQEFIYQRKINKQKKGFDGILKCCRIFKKKNLYILLLFTI